MAFTNAQYLLNRNSMVSNIIIVVTGLCRSYSYIHTKVPCVEASLSKPVFWHLWGKGFLNNVIDMCDNE